LLASIPLSRLRDAGVLDTLLELADSRTPAAESTRAADSGSLIDTMDSAALIELATRTGAGLD
jgi:hypothetical protein